MSMRTDAEPSSAWHRLLSSWTCFRVYLNTP